MMKQPFRSRLMYTFLGLGIVIMNLNPAVAMADSATANQPQGPTPLYLPLVSSMVPPKSTLALIAKALAAGVIDYPTSLLYRAYAQFGDARLPDAYQGNLLEEDSALQREYTASAGTLPASIKALLSPFMVRPDVAASAWSVYAAAHMPNSAQGSAAIPCNGQWASATSSV